MRGAVQAAGDGGQALLAAHGNEHHTAKLRRSAENLTTFLTDVGLIGGPSARLWRSARLI